MSGSTISLRSRDVPPSSLPPKEDEEIAAASSAWVPVDREVSLEHFSDPDDDDEEEEEEGKDDSVTELRRCLTSSLNNDDDVFGDDEENVCHRRSKCCVNEEKEELTTNCCNPKGICHTLVTGFCRVINTLVSCIKEKLTSRHVFMLAGAAIAAIFKTKNVATESEEDPSTGEEDGDDSAGDSNIISSSASVNNMSDILINTIVDATVLSADDFITHKV